MSELEASASTRIVLITGSSSGIGASCVSAFARDGATVCATDVKGPDPFGLAAISATADVRDPAAIDDFVRAITQEYGRIDTVINCAGVGVDDSVPVHQMSDSVWERTIGINLTGTFNVCRAAIPAMTAKGGSIIAISSIMGHVGNAGAAAYTSSKAGVLGLVRSMALDYATIGLRVNALCPGYINTPMVQNYVASFDEPEVISDMLNQAHPVGRMGLPEEIASAALWLSSDGARFVTGTSIPVDGGYLAR